MFLFFLLLFFVVYFLRSAVYHNSWYRCCLIIPTILCFRSLHFLNAVIFHRAFIYFVSIPSHSFHSFVFFFEAFHFSAFISHHFFPNQNAHAKKRTIEWEGARLVHCVSFEYFTFSVSFFLPLLLNNKQTNNNNMTCTFDFPFSSKIRYHAFVLLRRKITNNCFFSLKFLHDLILDWSCWCSVKNEIKPLLCVHTHIHCDRFYLCLLSLSMPVYMHFTAATQLFFLFRFVLFDGN